MKRYIKSKVVASVTMDESTWGSISTKLAESYCRIAENTWRLIEELDNAGLSDKVDEIFYNYSVDGSGLNQDSYSQLDPADAKQFLSDLEQLQYS